MWLLIIWSNDYRIWLWQHDGFSWQEVLTTGCCYGLKVGKKLERNHGMCAKGRMDLWAWGGRLSWANKYEMRTTVRLFMEKFLLILLQLCEVQCQSVIAPVGWGWIRSYFIKINQERAQMKLWILTLLPKRHFNLNFGANGAALQGLIGGGFACFWLLAGMNGVDCGGLSLSSYRASSVCIYGISELLSLFKEKSEVFVVQSFHWKM